MRNAIAIGLGVLVLIIGIGSLSLVDIVHVEGDEVAVRQHWQRGVVDDVLTSGTHFIVPGWAWKQYIYKIGTQKLTFDNVSDVHKDVEYGRIPVEIGENGGQEAYVAISINYHLNPSKVVALHRRGIGNTYESVVLKREVVKAVNEVARPHKSALDIFSGAGFVTFMNEVDKELQDSRELKDTGIEIENTIINGVHLDPAYEAEIKAKTVAIQQVLRKVEETKAAEQEAKRIFAMAQASVEQTRQNAESLKITQVTAAQGQAEQVVLAANADKASKIAAAEGERDANLAKASGVLAVGKAEADVANMKTMALYAGEGGARRASIELAAQQALITKNMFAGVNVLPEKAFIAIGKSGGLIVDGKDSQ